MGDVADLIDQHSAIIGLVLLVLLFAAFVFERFPPVVVGVVGAATVLLLGFVSVGEIRAVFSNSAPMAIGALFILSGALVRTGAIDAVLGFLVRRAKDRPKRVLAEVLAGALGTASVVNNTPVVIIMIPIVKRLCRSMGVAATKLLIPVSYLAIMGGTLTLVGTSTNLLVDGIAREAGQPAFGIFEITGVGAIAAVSGVITLLLLGPSFLPSREESQPEEDDSHECLSELRVRSTSELIGRKIGDIRPLRADRARLLAIKRNTEVIRADIPEQILAAGDRLVIAASPRELAAFALSENFEVGIAGLRGGLVLASDERAPDVQLYEATLAPTHPSIGGNLDEIPMLSRFNIRILGISRARHLPGPEMRKARLRAADTLLIAARAPEIDALRENVHLAGFAKSKATPYRRAKAPIAILTMLSTIVLAALGVMPIEGLAIIGVAVVLMTRTIDPGEAWTSIDGNLLVLIFSMLAIGTGFQNAGSVDLIVGWVAPWLAMAPKLALIGMIYALTSLLTEAVTNNAVAVVMTPIAIGLGLELGVDPRPLLIAVMMAASASFATPIGYQTNTLVYGAADYRFSDFLKIGIPMNIVVGLASVFAIYWLI